MRKTEIKTYAASLLAVSLLALPFSVGGETISFSNVKSTLVGSNLEDFTDSDAVYSLCNAGSRLVFGGDLDSGYIYDGEEYLFSENGSFDVMDGFVGVANFNSGASLADLRFALAGNQLLDEYASIRSTAANKTSFFAGGYLYGDSEEPWGVIIHGSFDDSEIRIIGQDGDFQHVKFEQIAVDGNGTIFALGTDIDGYAYLLSLNGDGDILWDDFIYLGQATDGNTRLLLSPDESTLYAAVEKSLYKLTINGEAVGTEFVFTSGISDIAVDNDGSLAVVTDDAKLHRMTTQGNLAETSVSQLFENGSGIEINSISIAPDKRLIIAGSCTREIFKATDRSAFSGIRAGFVMIKSPDLSETLFSSYLGNGQAEVFDTVFANDILTVGGATVETGWVDGGFCTNGEAKGSNRTWGFVKSWTGAAMVPDPDGAVKVNITPRDGKWQINGSSWLDSGFATNLPPGTAYTVMFKSILDHKVPSPISGIAKSGITNIYNAAYTYVTPPLAKREFEGTKAIFHFNLPANAAYAEVVESFPQSSDPSPIVTDSSILIWQPRTRRLTFYSDQAQEYQLRCTTNGVYRISGTVTVYDGQNNILSNAVPVEGDEVFVYPTGLLMTVQ